MTNKDYDKLVKKASPNSKLLLDTSLAFVTGGSICVIGQLLLNLYLKLNIDKETASNLTSVSMIFIGAFLTALNVYGDIARFGGAGTLVPITGFANSVVSSAMEFKSEGFIMGLGTKIFIIAGPVVVYAVISGVVCGILKYIMLIFGG
ncbi:MAG: SpoVA/SpoVAEb family sporulation membrane protein [Ruminococcaceae bacterium]|nr:SpoVA/SpoVAEb family sporulation membrane protein [Oscillospiraceae bacterium]